MKKLGKLLSARTNALPWAGKVSKAVSLIQDGQYRELLSRADKQLRAKVKAGHSSPKAKRPTRGALVDPQAARNAFERIGKIGLTHFLSSLQKLHFSEPKQVKVSVLLVLFNKAELTLACLRSLLEIRDLDFEVIVIDNASTDATPDLLAMIEGAKVVLNRENVGFLLACNQGAELARGEHLLLLNNDTVVLPGSIAAAIRTLESSKAVGAVGARIINLDGRLQEAGSFFLKNGSCQGYGRGAEDPSAPEFMFRRDVDYCSGAFLLTPLALFRSIGGFDKDYAPAYYEEADYCMRLWRRGFRVVYEPQATIFHYEFASASSPSRSIQWMLDHQKLFREKHFERLDAQPEKDPFPSLKGRIALKSQRTPLLFIEDRVPHITLGAGYPRSNAALREFEALGFDVTMYPTVTSDEPWPSVYTDISPTVEIAMGRGLKGLASFLAERKGHYPVIFVSRPDNMREFRATWKKHSDWFEGTKIIYDAEAFFCLRNHAYQALTGNPWSEIQLEKEVHREAILAEGCSTVLAVSEHERLQFERHGARNSKVLGYGFVPKPTPASFAERKDFLFVGSMHFHPSPNSDSILWFAREIFPRVREALGADVKLLIAGLNRTQEIQSLESDSIQLLGVVPDLGKIFNDSRVFIAPTRFAAGIPLKVQEAAGHGLPVVTTNLIAQQLNWEHERALLCSPVSDPIAFADNCIRLYQNAALWKSLRTEALAKIADECSIDRFRQTLKSALRD